MKFNPEKLKGLTTAEDSLRKEYGEKGETDMQLSTFLMISDVVGLRVSLSFA